MEGLQEDTIAARAAGNTGQGSVKQGRGQREGQYPDQTHIVKSEPKETAFHYWNQDALSHWLGPENLGWALVDGI